MIKKLMDETKPMKYLRLYRWLKTQGYPPKIARTSARMQAGYSLMSSYYTNYWKFR
jgi:hypothetical protein